jgi:LAO/AO transport system kinase
VTGAEITAWGERIRGGDLRALARAATVVENHTPHAIALLKELFPHTGKAAVIGITGSPGAGKSTLVDQFARVLRAQSKQVGIIAVDPTSPFTGGAILGDRIRMQEHHGDPGVFIRSMATRGWLGGLSRATTDMAILLDAAGRDVILVETVGVGQDEVEIARLADVTIVTLVPGMGDDVQAIKAGIMEIADVFVINKADQPGADRLEREIRANLSLGMRPDFWMPPVVHTVASEGKGIAEALDQVFRYLAERRRDAGAAAQAWKLRLREMLRDRLLERFSEEDFGEAAVEVAARRKDPYTVIDEMLLRRV